MRRHDTKHKTGEQEVSQLHKKISQKSIFELNVNSATTANDFGEESVFFFVRLSFCVCPWQSYALTSDELKEDARENNSKLIETRFHASPAHN